MQTPVRGILEQFQQLGGILAVSLCDAGGNAVASVGDPGATVALTRAVARLLKDTGSEAPIAALFEDADELTARRAPGTDVNLHLRRVGDDWALAAVWTADVPVDRIRSYAAETATRIESVS